MSDRLVVSEPLGPHAELWEPEIGASGIAGEVASANAAARERSAQRWRQRFDGWDLLEHALERPHEVAHQQTSPGSLEHLMSASDLADVIGSRRFADGGQIGGDKRPVTLFRDGRSIGMSQVHDQMAPARPDIRLAPARLAALISSGVTAQVQQIDEYVPAVRAMAGQISRLLYGSVHTGCFVSDGAVGGLAEHWDSFEVLVIQLEGRKAWRIRAPEVEFDHEGLGLDHGRPQEVLFDGVLEPGDALWVPQGAWHEVAPVGGWSLGLSFGVTRPTFFKALRWVKGRAAADPGWRRPVELGTAPTSDLLDADALAAYRAHALASMPVQSAARWDRTMTLFGGEAGHVPVECPVAAVMLARLPAGRDGWVAVGAGGRRLEMPESLLRVVLRVLGDGPTPIRVLSGPLESTGIELGAAVTFLLDCGLLEVAADT